MALAPDAVTMTGQPWCSGDFIVSSLYHDCKGEATGTLQYYAYCHVRFLLYLIATYLVARSLNYTNSSSSSNSPSLLLLGKLLEVPPDYLGDGVETDTKT